MAKLPAFQFYPADWRKDPGVQALSFNDRGVWFEILCLMHESEQRGKLLLNGRPMSEDSLARVLGLDKQILTTTLTTLSELGVSSVCPTTGALMSRRMVRDEEIRQIRAKSGKLGGNPALCKQNGHVLLNQKPTTHLNQNPTPSSSSSSSTPYKGGGVLADGLEVTDEMAGKWLAGRKAQGADYTWKETQHALMSCRGNGWKHGAADWRATLERQIQWDRDRKPPQKKNNSRIL